jgi:Ni2+-binding GTPase involved in maturation of urease and hydrogenase
VAGAVGSGKTTLCNRLVAALLNLPADEADASPRTRTSADANARRHTLTEVRARPIVLRAVQEPHCEPRELNSGPHSCAPASFAASRALSRSALCSHSA